MYIILGSEVIRKLSVVTALVVILSFAAGLAGVAFAQSGTVDIYYYDYLSVAGGGHFGTAGASISGLVSLGLLGLAIWLG